jgi:hypothetical protein
MPLPEKEHPWQRTRATTPLLTGRQISKKLILLVKVQKAATIGSTKCSYCICNRANLHLFCVSEQS